MQNKKVGSKWKSLKENWGIHEKLGVSVEEMFQVPSDCRYIYVSRNYIFYKIEEDCIKIINIYNEKEDFMWSLLGIDTTLQETLDYWNE